MRARLAASVISLLLAGGAHAAWPQNGPVPAAAGAFTAAAVGGPERTVVGGGIAHCRFDVRVGPGPFDVIQIHRVVREQRPYQPVQTADGVFLVPASPQHFDRIFLPRSISSVPAWDHAFAVFLAKNDIDVWGVTFGWNLAGPETADFTFMKGWGVSKDSWHTEIALSIARGIRGTSGLGSGPLHLLGFSYGVYVVYAVAAEETAWPSDRRNIKGLIPVDAAFKFRAGSPRRLTACSNLRDARAMLDRGQYHLDETIFRQRGNLALSQPDVASPTAAPLTNYEAALNLGKGFFVGASLEESGKPLGLLYTEPRLWIDLLRATPPFATLQQEVDASAVRCGEVDVPFDDRLGEIAVPILYVGAVGGVGRDGFHAATLTKSQDVSEFIVDRPRFAHADLFLARDAETLVWKPILDWIRAHR